MVLEAQLVSLLQRYLGTYVRGLSREALSVSVWKGDVELRNLHLRAEALNELHLPVVVKAGFLGRITLKIPWNKLGQQPVIVLIDRLYLLAAPATKQGPLGGKPGGNEDASVEVKRQRIADLEERHLHSGANLADANGQVSPSWIQSLISTVIGNLKLSITNVHIRYEDQESNPGHPFAAGLTLAKLAAYTVDEHGRETFATGNALDRLLKFVEMRRLAAYFDPDAKLWNPKEGLGWETLSPEQWSAMFEPGIEETADGDEQKRNREEAQAAAAVLSDWPLESPAEGRQFVLKPVGLTARYSKLATHEQRRAEDVPYQKASAVLDTVSVTVTEPQYRDVMKLVEAMSYYQRLQVVAQYRPKVTVKDDPKRWWHFAYKAVVHQGLRFRHYVLWEDVLKLSTLRKRYIPLYANLLAAGGTEVASKNTEIKEIDKDLPEETAAMWRLLAHAQLKKAGRAAAKKKPKSWFSSWWGGESDANGGSEGLSEEEWARINQLVGYEVPSDIAQVQAEEDPRQLQLAMDVTMQRSTVQLLPSPEAGDTPIMSLFTNGFHLGYNMFSRTHALSARLETYGLSTPEGCMAQSTPLGRLGHAFIAEFVYQPMEPADVDWTLAATSASCIITVWRASIDRLVAFLQAGAKASPNAARQTAEAFQVKLDEVRRSARQQLDVAMRQRPRFTVDLDLEAPKVSIPTSSASGEYSQLLLDLGHLTIKTEAQPASSNLSKEEMDLYYRFRLLATDISAFVADGPYDWQAHSAGRAKRGRRMQTGVLSVLDNCNVAAALHQACIPHPKYPSLRVAVGIPSVGLRFSPARLRRILSVTQALVPTSGSPKPAEASPEQDQPDIAPANDDSWRQDAEWEGPVRVLTWKGIGQAVWKRRWVVLTGIYLYTLESRTASTYVTYTSLLGKVVKCLQPEKVGGRQQVVAVCYRSAPGLKAEETHAVVLAMESDRELRAAVESLTNAVYRASTPATLLTGGDHPQAKGEESKLGQGAGPLQQTFQLVGVLEELKLDVEAGSSEVKERLLVRLAAKGTRVELMQRPFDMAVGVGLESLEVEDHLSPGHYIVRSFLAEGSSSPQKRPPPKQLKLEHDQSPKHDRQDSVSSTNTAFFDASEELPEEENPALQPPNFKTDTQFLPETKGKEAKVEMPQGGKSFVLVQLVMLQKESPDYQGTDMLVRAQLATLGFYVNRPTVIALMKFGEKLSRSVKESGISDTDGSQQLQQPGAPEAQTSVADGDEEPAKVSALLGQGKGRTLLNVEASMGRAEVIFGLEDNHAELAKLEMIGLTVKFRQFPSSLAVCASLGNLRVSDGYQPPDHPYRHILDMRDKGDSSFIEVEFESLSPEEDDYEGYEYSLRGRLAAVRIVFLYRFIQELLEYVTQLAPSAPAQLVQLGGTVAGEVGRYIWKSELEGQPAIKFDIELSRPFIVMPQHSKSKQYLELDVVRVTLRNKSQWHGGSKDNLEAVHFDEMVVGIENVELFVGIDGRRGPNIIEELSGFQLTMLRPLRDLRKVLPGIDISIQTGKLRAGLSSQEYAILLKTVTSNMAEEPNLPPDPREITSNKFEPLKLTEAQSAPKGDTGQGSRTAPASPEGEGPPQPWATVRLSLDLKVVELELYTSVERDQSLALAQVFGTWVGYRSRSNGEALINLTIRKVLLVDRRDKTDPAMRKMLGSAAEPDLTSSTARRKSSSESTGPKPTLSMLVMDAQISPTNQIISIRAQKPRVLVAIDSLLAVAMFFLPSLNENAATEEGQSVEDDPLGTQNDILLTEPVYVQEKEVEQISPSRQLVVAGTEDEEFVYDGKGRVLELCNVESKPLKGRPMTPIIVVAPGKTLRFKDVVIKNAEFLDVSVHLEADSQYTVEGSDGVILEVAEEVEEEAGALAARPQAPAQPTASKPAAPVAKMLLHVQVVGAELTFYDATEWPAKMALRPEKLLRARTDAYAMVSMKGPDMWVRGLLKGLEVEGFEGKRVLEPLVARADYSVVAGKQDLSVSVSSLALHLSFSTLRLLLRLQADIVATLHLTSDEFTYKCTQFDRVWFGKVGGEDISIWRPRVPQGYSSLGDCVIAGPGPPAQSVLALSTSYARARKPCRYNRIWSSSGGSRQPEAEGAGSSAQGSEEEEGCSLWAPVAPEGYVAVGYVAERSGLEPPPGACFCARRDLLVPAAISDCLALAEDGVSIWRVENSVGTFTAQGGLGHPPSNLGLDLRDTLRFAASSSTPEPITTGKAHEDTTPETDDTAAVQATTPSVTRLPQRSFTTLRGPASNNQMPSLDSGRPSGSPAPTPGALQPKLFMHTPTLTRVWWDKAKEGKEHPSGGVSVWRPVAPPGFVSLGDITVQGYEPPAVGLVVRDVPDGSVKAPLRFESLGHLKGKKAVLEEATIWWPVAPDDYVALGCILMPGQSAPEPKDVRCLRRDLAAPTSCGNAPLWTSGNRATAPCAFWQVQNKAGTFLCSEEEDEAPSHAAYTVAALQQQRLPDSLALQARVPRISIALYDDFGGLMTPLVEAALASVQVSAHGRPELMSLVAGTSIGASLFNAPLDAWEPLIEPWEALVKFEYSAELQSAALPATSRIRVSGNQILNIDMASSGVHCLLEAYLAWNAITKLEEDARRQRQQMLLQHRTAEEGEDGAMEENEEEPQDAGLGILNVQNKTGMDMFVRSIDRVAGRTRVIQVPANRKTKVPLPQPSSLQQPSFQPGTGAASGEGRTVTAVIRKYVAVRVAEAKGLPAGNAIHKQELLCALRLASDSPGSGPTLGPEGAPSGQVQDDLLERQSGRTRAVVAEPVADDEGEGSSTVAARWDEVFVFELPQEAPATLEVVITNQAANGGKGELVGALSAPVGRATGPKAWSKVKSALRLNLASAFPDLSNHWYPLHPLTSKPSPPKADEIPTPFQAECGALSLAMHLFTVGEKDKEAGSPETAFGPGATVSYSEGVDLDHTEGGLGAAAGLQLGLTPRGPWATLRSMLALGSFPKRVGRVEMSVDVKLDQGQKTVLLRSLVRVENSTNRALAICVCPRALLAAGDEEAVDDEKVKAGESQGVEAEEEIFENQRYVPLRGWGSDWPGHLLPTDPARWTNSSGSFSSQDFIEPPLPSGWEWAGDWQVDTSGNVGSAGWAYAGDFLTLQWPPSKESMARMSALDFVRRRRWVRVRRRSMSGEDRSRRMVVGVLQPGESTPLPLPALDPAQDTCVQVRPLLGKGDTDHPTHKWGIAMKGVSDLDKGRELPDKHFRLRRKGVPASDFMLRRLQQTTELLCCQPNDPEAATVPGPAWLSVRAESTKLQTAGLGGAEVVSDWRIVVASSLSLENLLPLKLDFTLLRREHHANKIAQEGCVAPGGRASLFGADPRYPLLLTVKPEQGWRMEQEAVVIWHPLKGPAALMWLVNAETGRRVQVSLHHLVGKARYGERLVRLLVPYWLQTAPGLPLSFKFVELKSTGRPRRQNGHLWSRTKHIQQGLTEAKGKQDAHHGSELVPVVDVAREVEEIRAPPCGQPVMLSPKDKDYAGLRISLAGTEEEYGPAFRLSALEDQHVGRVELHAADTGGQYLKLVAWVEACPSGHLETKVVKFLPHTVLTNRLGEPLLLRQAGLDHPRRLEPQERSQPLIWCSPEMPELLEVRTEESGWSAPFAVEVDTTISVVLGLPPDATNEVPRKKLHLLRAEVRSVAQQAQVEIVFRRAPTRAGIKIENRASGASLWVRQEGSPDTSWQLLQPRSAVGFAWDKPKEQERRLEVRAADGPPEYSRFFSLKQHASPIETLPAPQGSELHVTIHTEGTEIVVRFSANPTLLSNLHQTTALGAPLGGPPLATSAEGEEASVVSKSTAESSVSAGGAIELSVDLSGLGLSLVDHTPQELLFLSMENFRLAYSYNLVPGMTRLQARVGHLQIDNQVPRTTLPVLLAPVNDRSKKMPPYVLQLCFTMQEQLQPGVMVDSRIVYPYIGLQTPDIAWRVSVHEPIVWRLWEMYENWGLNRLSENASQEQPVRVDPYVRISLLNVSENRLKVTVETEPGDRPPILGVWGHLISAIGNTRDMHMIFEAVLKEKVVMRQSAMPNALIQYLEHELLSQPLRLLRGVDLLANTSGALAAVGRVFAHFSMDPRFQQWRNDQERAAHITGFSKGVSQGGRSLFRGFWRGFSGLVFKPVEGAYDQGAKGVLTGCGKGLLGLLVQPCSGCADFASQTVDGVDASINKIISGHDLQRKRPPRAIRADRVLQPYDEHHARGQEILTGIRFSGKLEELEEDMYHDYFELPRSHTLLTTNRHLLMLLPKRIHWRVSLSDILALELAGGVSAGSRNNRPSEPDGPPQFSRVVVHLRTWSEPLSIFEGEQLLYTIRCTPSTPQALQVRGAIQEALGLYTIRPRKDGPKPPSRQRVSRSPDEKGCSARSAAPLVHDVASRASTSEARPAEPEEEGPAKWFRPVEQVELIWWNKCSRESKGGCFGSCSCCSRKKGAVAEEADAVSIWRPVVPLGCASVGDIIVLGYDPPTEAKVIRHDDADLRLAKPEDFDLVWRDAGDGENSLTLWAPRPPEGYKAVGHVAMGQWERPHRSMAWCVRGDCIAPAKLASQEPTFRPSNHLPSLWSCGMWRVANEQQTCVAQRNLQQPPENLALQVVIKD